MPKIIKDFMADGYRVVVALTKSSQNDTQHTLIMERTIREFVAQKLGSEGEQIVQKQLAVIPVCSVEKKLRSGMVTHPFGKEALARAVLDSWRVTVLGRLPSAVIERLEASVKEFVNGEIVALENKEVSGNLDASMNREIVDGFYYRLNNFTNDLLQTKYSGIVLELIEQASDIETALMKAMSIPSNSVIAFVGISHFMGTIRKEVTGATWLGRIASFGISAIVGRFSSKAQGEARYSIEAQFQYGKDMACESIAAKKAQTEKGCCICSLGALNAALFAQGDIEIARRHGVTSWTFMILSPNGTGDAKAYFGAGKKPQGLDVYLNEKRLFSLNTMFFVVFAIL